MARKNIGAKPYIMPMPVLLLSAYDWMNKIYLSLGEKVGNAYKDGLALR